MDSQENMTQNSNTHRWTVDDAAELYELGRWGQDYFSIGESGHLLVHPRATSGRPVDLVALIEQLRRQGLHPPLLVRFADLLEHRLGELREAFVRAVADHQYQGETCCVYPIKVNQQRQVVEEVLHYGRPHGFGLEAGSKPELLAVLALADNNTPIICNGFKDAEYIETVMLAQQIGRNIIPVVERPGELPLLLDCAERAGVRPRLGMRVKLAARGAGRWQASGGSGSKFGLTVSEILEGLALLRRHGMLDCFELLHFHLGSQITNIRLIKSALTEAARVYVGLVAQGAGLKTLDVGGGLGVDYDGSQTNFESSVNYTLQEYANDVIYYVRNVCDDARVAHPAIITESGRATVAYHSMLVFDVLGTSSKGDSDILPPVPSDAPQPLADLQVCRDNITVRNLPESFHDAQQALETSRNLFASGYLTIGQRGAAEKLFWNICHLIRRQLRHLEYVPDELAGLDDLLCDTYFCNFSVFQSLPDSWAIKQLFPIMPIVRLDQRPTRRAVLADVTCDSDGKVDRFVDRRDVRRTLPLHEPNGEPYYLGAFLVGAYQEILGDLHNLFGDTNAVHVKLGRDAAPIISRVVQGDKVREVLGYVQFDDLALVDAMHGAVDAAVKEGRIEASQGERLLEFYRAGLDGTTYLKATLKTDAQTIPVPLGLGKLGFGKAKQTQ